MQITETKAEGLKREFKIVVPAAKIEEQVDNRLKELTHTVRMPGFRPGKVPASLLRKKYGQSVRGEVLERSIGESSSQTMTDRGLRPAMQPEIEIVSFDEGEDLEYTMVVELFPEIEPIDPAAITLEQLVAKADEETVEKTLQRLADAHKTSEVIASKRKSKTGDILLIDFVGRVDGEEFQGGKAESYLLELGSNSLIPGFEEQLVGAKAGEEVKVEVTFPEDYGAENLAGKAAVFDVSVRELRKSVAAAIDDDLAKKVGTENLEALRKAIGEDHDREFKNISRLRLKRALLDNLADTYSFEVPEGMVEREFEAIWKQIEEQRQAGSEADDPEDEGKSDDELKAEYRAISERRVRLGLLLVEVGRLNNLSVGREEVNRAIAAEARRYPGQEKAVFDYYRDTPEAMEAIRAPLMEDKVVDFILEMAEITERTVSVDELLAEPDEAEKAAAEGKPKKKRKSPARKKPKKEEASAEEEASEQ